MNGNVELLNFVYQNSEMGVNTIKQLKEIAVDGDFRKHLQSQLNEYDRIHTTAKSLLNKNNYDEKGISALDKIKTYLMINIQTLTDKTPSHIAEMLIIGSNMGVIDAIKNIRKYAGAEKEALDLMKKLLQFEEDNIIQLKKFL
ncbi:MAG: hypothetical protein VB095_09705 [Anaerovorax sp.]|nr:hypothetical protein [Anaerovorax sp.]